MENYLQQEFYFYSKELLKLRWLPLRGLFIVLYQPETAEET